MIKNTVIQWGGTRQDYVEQNINWPISTSGGRKERRRKGEKEGWKDGRKEGEKERKKSPKRCHVVIAEDSFVFVFLFARLTTPL